MGKIIVEKRGRVTIPSDVRKILGIKEGTELEVSVEEGKILLKPVIKTSAVHLYGIAGEEEVNLKEVEDSLSEGS